ncbi:MAG: hypothetical protein K1V81_01520 [Paramuribaculum sp.]|nr:hypothetical protein [Paramuribaculum sp.]
MNYRGLRGLWRPVALGAVSADGAGCCTFRIGATMQFQAKVAIICDTRNASP